MNGMNAKQKTRPTVPSVGLEYGTPFQLANNGVVDPAVYRKSSARQSLERVGFMSPNARFTPEKNVTRLHPSYYNDPEVQQMELQERDRVKNMEWDAQASANRSAATDSATTSTRGRRRNGARSSTNLRKTLDYLRAL